MNIIKRIFAAVRGPQGPAGPTGCTGQSGRPGASCHEQLKVLRMGPADLGPATDEKVTAIEQFINLARPQNLVSIERTPSEAPFDNYVLVTYRDDLGSATILINLDTFHAKS